jgi:hypothetical protein
MAYGLAKMAVVPRLGGDAAAFWRSVSTAAMSAHPLLHLRDARVAELRASGKPPRPLGDVWDGRRRVNLDAQRIDPGAYLRAFKPRELASLVFAMARAGHAGDDELQFTAMRVAKRPSLFSTYDLSVVVWAFAKVRVQRLLCADASP